MGFKKGNTHGNRFSPSNQPKKRGRKTNIFAQLKKDVEGELGCKVADIDVNSILAMAAFGSQELHNAYLKGEDGKVSSKTPMAIMNYIRALQIQTQKGNTDAIERIFDRLYGKATQPLEGNIDTNVTHNVDLSVLSVEELMQYNALLEKVSKGKESKDNKENGEKE